jgi:hypothetical protein
MRFGLLVNGPKLQQWQYHAVQKLIEDGHEPVLAVMRCLPRAKVSLFQKLTNYPLNNLLYRIWQRYLFRPTAKKELDISHLLNTMHLIECTPEIRGITEWIPEATALKVKTFGLDFMLRFGFNIIRGSLLDVPTYGIWSFHHDDEQLIRGGPPGFWEVYHRHEVNGVVLQRITEKLDAGELIEKIWLPVIRHSYKAHLNQILSESAFMPAKACRRISMHGMKASAPEKKGKLYRNPNNLRMLRFMLRMPYQRLTFHLNQLLKQESWKIGISTIGRSQAVKFPDQLYKSIRWISHPSAYQYLADPFIIDFQEENIILAEQFDYRSGKGKLVRLMPAEGYRAVPVDTPGDFHWSFPFLLVKGEQLFCLPECYTSGALSLLEFDPVHNRLMNPLILISDVEALDPVLFEHQGLWWLLFSQKNMPGVQLFAWFSENLTGPYNPHPLNPLKTDPRSARNAGAPFYHEGKLIRPAQDSSGSYGKAVVLCSIEVLTRDNFAETEIGRIEPDKQWAFHSGLHTFNGTHETVMIDAKSYRFSLAGFRHTWKLKTRKTK